MNKGDAGVASGIKDVKLREALSNLEQSVKNTNAAFESRNVSKIGTAVGRQIESATNQIFS